MMSLQDLKDAIDQLSPEERAELLAYIYEQEQRPELRAGTMNVDALLEGAAAIRAEMSAADFEAMLDAMEEEYVEPLDDDGLPK